MKGKKAKLLKKVAKQQLAEFQEKNPGQLQLTYKAYPRTLNTKTGLLIPRVEEYPINHVRRIVRAMVTAERLSKMNGKKAA